MEPEPCRWAFPPPHLADEYGLLAEGADLEPGTLLTAYRMGIFPMPLRRRRMGWWSPDPRGVVPLDGLRVSRSLRRSCSRYRVAWDQAFDAVLEACADPKRPGGWINRDIRQAYRQLHELGWAHSVETYGDDGELVGGLYGVSIGRLFAGESMFHRRTDASKVALVELVRAMRVAHMTLLDVQWLTPHLASLGAMAIPRDEYLEQLSDAVAAPSGRLPPRPG